jgi:hypothetical protein
VITALTTDVVQSGDNYLYVFKGTPSARQAVRPGRARAGGAEARGEIALDDSEVPRRRRLGSRGSLAVVGGSLARCLSVGTHGAGRCRSAVPPHPPPTRPPAVTHPRWPRLQELPGRPPAPGMLPPGKLPVKGTAYGRVPPLRSGQTPDSELPRQDQALAGRTGKERSKSPTECLVMPLSTYVT